jgi:ATP-binding cassette subfamily B protein
LKKFTNYKQTESKDCGPTCLKIIAKHYGKTINIQELRNFSETTRTGSNLLFLSEAAEKIGFRTLGVKLSLESVKEASLPCILFWNKNHYVVLYKIKNGKYYISDPAFGLLEYNEEAFLKFWIGNNANELTQEGVALMLEATPKFFQSEFDKEERKGLGFDLLFQYKSFLIQLSVN